jgi:hypothetical protein
MAEHPGTPGTAGSPDPSDDDLSPTAFDGLGLGSLADDVRPSRAEWSAMVVAASERHGQGRRPWLISAAAVVVLVVAVTGLVIARSGREQPDVVAGFGSTDTRLLPPANARDVTAVRIPDDGSGGGAGSVIFFTDDAGAWVLRQGLPAQIVDQARSWATTPTTAGSGFAVTSKFGDTWLSCSGLISAGSASADGSSTTVVTLTGPATALFLVGGSGAWVSPNITGNEPASQPCTDQDPVLGTVDGLRVVGTAEFEQFLGTVPVSTPEYGPATSLSAPTTLPDDPPADRGSAEEQIRTAVAAWNQTDADGSFPNLEAGTEKSAEYAEMFDTAAKQSGAAQAGDGSGNSNSVSTIRFVTPERAAIVMSLTAKLPTGTFTFPQDGEAILQDGRWVVTYRTVINTLRRACTPPGGYDGCPDDGNGTPVAVPID